MRSRRIAPTQILARLLMAALLLVGLMANAHLSMAHSSPAHGTAVQALEASSPTHHAVAANVGPHEMSGHMHSCCESSEAVETCLVACAAVACATPVLPGVPSALISPDRAGVKPVATRLLRSQAPDIETPPPKFRL